MAKAVWNGEVVAESKKVKEVGGQRYFPPNSVRKEFLKESYTHFVDQQKGTANFYNIAVNDKVNWNAAWYFPEPKKEVTNIKNYIAFSPAVDIEE